MLERKPRRWRYLSMDDIKKIGREINTKTVWRDAMENPMMVTSDRLAGKKMQFRFENDLLWSYEFFDERRLRWQVSDGRGGEEIYNASPAPGYPDLIWLHHYCSLEIPACADLYIDFETGYALLFDASLGQPDNPREVQRTIRFGVIEGAKTDPAAPRPQYTNDLTGRAIRWKAPGSASRGGIKYIFSSCRYLTYAMKWRGTNYCWMSTNPCDYLKLRDDLYICSTIEERQTGVELLMLMNTTLLTDVQTEFGMGGPVELESRLQTSMRSGRQGVWDEIPVDFFSEDEA